VDASAKNGRCGRLGNFGTCGKSGKLGKSAKIIDKTLGRHNVQKMELETSIRPTLRHPDRSGAERGGIGFFCGARRRFLDYGLRPTLGMT
jgi:hypothetical protein